MAFDITLTMTYFAFLLGFGVIIANLLKKARIPDTLFLLLLGLILGPTVFMNPLVTQYISIVLVDVTAMGAVPDFLRVLALILVVFTGMFNLSWKVFKKFSDMSVNLAFVGVLFNTVFLGFFASIIFGFSPVYALLMGAVISGTAPAIVFSFERSLSKYKKAITVMKVESILNSPLTVLFPILFLDLVVMEPGALFEPMKYLSQFWLMIVAGLGTGLIIGLAVSKIMRGMLKEYSSLILFAIALITYALAENVGGSGMLAVAVCGLISGNIVFPERDKEEVKRFEDQFTEMLRISVLTLLGAQVMLPLDPGILLVSFIFFLIVFFSRPIFLIPTLGKQRKKFSRKELVTMSFIAPKGMSEAAMAPIVAAVLASVGAAAIGVQMVNIIFMVILFSVIFSTVIAIIMGTKVVQEMGGGKEKHKEEKPKEPEFMKPEKLEKLAKPEEFSEDDYAEVKPAPEKRTGKSKAKKRVLEELETEEKSAT